MKILITGGSGFIGINLIDFFISKGESDIVNIDKAPSAKESHAKYWMQCNIMDEEKLQDIFSATQPALVIHLAARTDTVSDKLEDYEENHLGTQHLLNVIKKSPSVKRAIITSTQYVYKNDDKPFPSADDEFKNHTIYGQSKVLTEQYTRSANLECEWAIVRPTNIWGPWHMRYPNELWRMLDKGMYYHPVSHPVVRTYGYVKNIVHQIYNIATAPADKINHQVFYVGDASVDSFEWLNEISQQLTGKKIKKLPTFIFKTIALGGDLLNAIKIPFPLYSKRFKNMVEDYPAPTEKTIKMFGQAESDIKKNVAETIVWLKGEGSGFFNHWKKYKTK